MMKTFTLITTLLSLFITTNLYSTSIDNEVDKIAINFFKQKYVLATNSPFYNNSISYSYLNKMRYEDTLGQDEESLDGKYRTAVPEVVMMSNPLENEDALECEILSAKMMGIDGFKFEFEIIGNEGYVKHFEEVMSLYSKVAKERNLDFHFALEVVFPDQGEITDEQLLVLTNKRLTHLLKIISTSNKWVKTPNSKMILFTKNTSSVLGKNRENKKSILNLDDIKYVGDFFRKIDDELDNKVTFVYQISSLNHPTKEVLKYFPAISVSPTLQLNNKELTSLRKLCESENRVYVSSVLVGNQGVQLYHSSNDQEVKANMPELELSDTYVKGREHKMTETFRSNLQDAVKNNDQVIVVDSWNKFENGSHLAPEIHHGYALGIILKYYRAMWLEKEHIIEEELISVAFRNVLPNDLNDQNNINIKFDPTSQNTSSIDSIEITTLLKEKGDVFCNKEYIGTAQIGINTFYIQKKEGPIDIIIKRNNKDVLHHKSIKEITGLKGASDYMVYVTSNLDLKYSKYNQNIILDRKLNNMRNRFLLDNEKQDIWRTASIIRFFADREALLTYGTNSNKYLSIRKKNYKKYAGSIKALLGEFQFQIWEELEEEAKSNLGLDSRIDPKIETVKNYDEEELRIKS